MSDRPTVGVCGFGRCGTSMVMAMLAAGGLPPVEGSAEISFEVADLQGFVSWPPHRFAGRAVKLLDAPLHYGLPPIGRWGFVWLDRDAREQARSTLKFFRLIGVDPGQPDSMVVDALADSYRRDRPALLAMLRNRGEVVNLQYERVLAQPVRAARLMRRLVPDLDVRAAADQVHDRPPGCAPDCTYELTGAPGIPRRTR